jgi:hypothetical protein
MTIRALPDIGMRLMVGALPDATFLPLLLQISRLTPSSRN